MKRLIILLLPVLLVVGCSSKEPINRDEMLNERRGVYYTKDTNKPYSGEVFVLDRYGEKVIQGNLKDGKEDGLWVYEGENYEHIFKDGEIISSKKWKYWDSSREVKMSEWNEKGGKKDGLYTMWYESGEKLVSGHYKDGKAQGVWTQLHKNGKKERVTKFKDDKIIDAKEWNEDGSVREKFDWLGGETSDD